MKWLNSLNVKLSNSQLNQLKSGIKNFDGSSNNKTNFRHKLLLANKQVSKIRKAFANGSSAKIRVSKTQLSNFLQLGGYRPGPSMLPDITPLADAIINSLVKELQNTGI